MNASAQSREKAGAGQAGQAKASAEGSEAAAANPQQAYLQGLEKEQRKDPGLANYEAALGGLLGGKLHQAVSKAISFDKMSGYADSALGSAIDQVVAEVGDLAGDDVDPKALEAFGKALDQSLGPYVDAFMEGPGAELTDALQDWVDAHPRSVALVALLAAIGAIVANAEIPALKHRFKISKGISAKLEARLGRFQNISLEQISAQLEAHREFDSATLKARLEFVHNKEKGDTYHGELRLQTPDGKWVTGIAATHDRTGESVDAFLQRKWPRDNLAIELRGRMHDELGSQVTVGLKWSF